MLVLKEEAIAKIEVKKSRFIAIAKPCLTLKEAKEIVKNAWDEYPDATHIVHAAIVGRSGGEFSFSDDKEPKNTAGRPAFEVLKGSGITNIIVLVIRYFGGTLLGTGGLVKAYSDATKEVLNNAKTEELVDKCTLDLKFQYEAYNSVKRLLESLNASSLKETFGESVSLQISLPNEEKERLKEAFTNLTQGRGTLSVPSIP